MYNTDFKFFITTKMAKPHYSPEMCVKVTMLNFMVTQEGLQEFMLNIVVSLVETQRSEQRVRAIRDKAGKMKIMKELQDTLLDLVSNAGDDILENRALKETLDESAITKDDINTTLADIKSILDNMKAILQQFTPVAKRVSNLFFVLTDLVNVDPMY
jgi:dynein heavy chain, axonemal